MRGSRYRSSRRRNRQGHSPALVYWHLASASLLLLRSVALVVDAPRRDEPHLHAPVALSTRRLRRRRQLVMTPQQLRCGCWPSPSTSKTSPAKGIVSTRCFQAPNSEHYRKKCRGRAKRRIVGKHSSASMNLVAA